MKTQPKIFFILFVMGLSALTLFASVVTPAFVETSADKPKAEKTIICHKGKTIKVDEVAVAAHLAHGDTLGMCQ